MTTVRFVGQKLGGTSLDSQGECLALEDLIAYTEFCRGRRIPLHQRHDMSEPTTGFIENVRVELDEASPRNWVLLGDVTVQRGALNDGLRGFSISFVAPLVQRVHPLSLLYIPHPHYKDSALVAELSGDEGLNIGKWIKKSDSSEAIALFGAALAFALAPAWDHFYKAKVAPAIDAFLERHFATINGAGLGLEHVQVVYIDGEEVELRFIPERGKERWCFSHDALCAGIRLVAAKLDADPLATVVAVRRVVLRFEVSSREYEIVRIEYGDGAVA